MNRDEILALSASGRIGSTREGFLTVDGALVRDADDARDIARVLTLPEPKIPPAAAAPDPEPLAPEREPMRGVVVDDLTDAPEPRD